MPDAPSLLPPPVLIGAPRLGQLGKAYHHSFRWLLVYLLAMSALIVWALSIHLNIESRSFWGVAYVTLIALWWFVPTAFLTVATIRLAEALGAGPVVGILLCVVNLYPFVVVILFGVVHVRAARVLRKAGALVGSRWITLEEYTALRTNWCQACGYPRTGLAPATVCPECGAAA